MKEDFIDEKLKKIKEEKEQVNKSMDDLLSTINLLGGVFFGIVAVGALFLVPGIGTAALAIGGECAFHYYKNKDLKRQKLNRLNNEEKHLNDRKKTSPKQAEGLNQKRSNKIKALKNKKKKVEKDCKISSWLSKISVAATIAGAVVTSITPPLAFISALGLLGSAASGYALLNNNKKKEELDNRINNLEADRNIISLEEKERILKKGKAPKRPAKGDAHTKDYTKKAAMNTSSNEKLVDAYLKEKEKEGQEREFQKVKR